MNRTGWKLILVVGLLGLVTAGATVAYFKLRSRWVQLLDKEETNVNELDALQSAPLKPPTSTVQGWPQWLGPTRDGRTSETIRTDWNKNSPQVQWTVPCGGGHSSFAVVNGRVYTMDRQGTNERVLCLEAATGKTLWSHEFPANYDGMDRGHANGSRSTPAVFEDRVYTVGATGRFLGMKEPATFSGSPEVFLDVDLQARFNATLPQWGFAGSPLIDGDNVIVQPGGSNATLAAFDRKTGEWRWSAKDGISGYSSPIAVTVAGVRQIIGVTGSTVFGVRAADGQPLWSQSWATKFQGNVATPIVAGDYVFVSSSYQKGCSLYRLAPTAEGVSAERVYFRNNRVMRNHHSTCVYREGYLYGFDDNDLKCVNLRKGEAVKDWDATDIDGRAFAKGCVILVGKQLLGLTQTGTLFLADADPAEFKLHGSVTGVLSGARCWALPVFVEGKIYVRDDTKIVCLK